MLREVKLALVWVEVWACECFGLGLGLGSFGSGMLGDGERLDEKI